MTQPPFVNLSIRAQHYRQLIAAASPIYEICGLMSGHIEGQTARVASVHPIPNSHPQPTRHFTLEPAQFVSSFYTIQEAGETLLAIYHSHPVGSSHLSKADQANASFLNIAHVIIYDKQLYIWSLKDKKLLNLEIIS